MHKICLQNKRRGTALFCRITKFAADVEAAMIVLRLRHRYI